MLLLIALPGPSTQQVRERLEAWSSAHVLRPFCWWEVNSGEHDQTVRVVRRGQVTEESLGEATDGTFQGAVIVLPLSAGETAPPDLVEHVRPYVRTLQMVVPRLRGRPARPTLVVMPQEVGHPIDERIFSLEWEANVYVAPEDRRRQGDALGDPDELYASRVAAIGNNRLQGEPWRFGAHAAHAIASIGGLWMAPTHGDVPIAKLAERQPRALPVQVQVMRCFTDIVDFGFVTDQVASRVFRPGAAWPNPDSTRFVEAEAAERVLDRLATAYFDKHRDALGVSSFDPIELPRPPVYSIRDALRLLWREFWFRFWSAPINLAERIARSVINDVAERIEQAAGASRGWNVVRWEDRRPEQRTVDTVLTEIDRTLDTADGQYSQAWRDLRATSLALIDGARLPDGLDAEVPRRNERRIVITDPHRIVPPPAARSSNAGVAAEGHVCDPLTLDPRFAEPATVLDSEPGTADPPLTEDELIEFRNSLLWKVGGKLAAELREAQRVATPVEADEDEPGSEAGGDQPHGTWRRRRRNRRSGRARVVLTSIAIVATGIAAIVVEVLTLSLRLAIPGAFLTWLLVLALLVRLVRRAMHRRYADERSAVEALMRRLNDQLLRSLREGDALRLRRRYAEFLRWSAIVGDLAHTPWTGDPLTLQPLATQLREEELPAAVDRRVPSDAERMLEDLASIGRSAVFEPGWLSGLYRYVQRAAMLGLRRSQGYVPEELQDADLPDPAGGDPAGSGSPLVAMYTYVTNGEGRHLADNPLSVDMLRALAGHPVDAFAQRLLSAEELEVARRDEDRAGALPPSVAWFEPPANLAALGRVLGASLVRLRVETATGTVGGTGFVATSGGMIVTARHVVQGAVAVFVVMPDGVEHPAEVDARAGHTDVALVRCGAVAELPLLPLRSEQPVELGEPVVTLGFPNLLGGEATLAWGLVSAERRILQGVGLQGIEVFQASFPALGGASGSPVTDLAGRVVGVAVAIHERTSAQEDYMSFAVPVADVAALLAGHSVADDADGHRAPSSQRPRGVGRTPSSFLVSSGPADADGRDLLAGHWKDPTDRTSVELTLPDDVEHLTSADPVSRWVGGLSFRAPLVVILSRCEAVPLAPATALQGVDGNDEPPAAPAGISNDDSSY